MNIMRRTKSKESGIAMLLKPNAPNTGALGAPDPLGTPRIKGPCGRDESGIAMLLAIFTLLLLTALGLTLLCASDLETNIAANYRDKQVSMYGALSGLQEARDRLKPVLCDPSVYAVGACPAPAIEMRDKTLPTVDNHSVVYVVNPLNGEAIEPWNPSNPYFDTELCKENILGLSPGSGASCPVDSTSVPSGDDWYTVLNDTQTPAGVYRTGTSLIPTPLSFKWVRITVKTDKMTPAWVSKSPTGNTVECWTGTHQIPVTPTSGLKADCSSLNSVQLYYNGVLCAENGTTCNIDPPIGSGFTSPVVHITGGGGTGAAATAYVTSTGGGQVTGVTMDANHEGQDFTAAPTIGFVGDGIDAAATATIALTGYSVRKPNGLADVTQTDPVGCYATTPSVVIVSSNGVGTGATAVANMTGNTCIVSWSLTHGSGQCDQSNTITVGADGGGGSGFAGSVTLKANRKGFSSYTITNPGSGYTSLPTLTGLTGCTYTSTFTLGTQIKNSNSFDVTNGGRDYTVVPNVIITAPTTPVGTPAPSTSATLDSLKTGYISSITVTNPGSGYTSPPTVTITGDGTNASATATINAPTGQQIYKVKLDDGGSGYTSNAAVDITGGSGATGLTARPTYSAAGRVYVLTALADTVAKSKAMMQMEVATPVSIPFSLPGALTIDAPLPTIVPGSSVSYDISGIDANSCGETAYDPKVSVGVTDNVNSPTSPTAVDCITSTLGGAPDAACPAAGGVKTDNYTGRNPSPDVENVYESLGLLTTPAGCDSLATAIAEKANYKYTGSLLCNSESNCGIYNSTYPNDCPTYYIDGNLTVGPGNAHLCGVLLVTGILTMQGDYEWDGPIFVIGKEGKFIAGGGGNGVINGSLFVAKNRDSSTGAILPALDKPDVSFEVTGGGGNGIHYDHCKSDNMLRSLNLGWVTQNRSLQVLSVRTIN
jgi:Tfp pilus assembly protein PilX